MLGRFRALRRAPLSFADTSCSTIELKQDTIIVVLGASGDLAKKKTFPALFGLVWCPSEA